jgi:hypothetical protein
MQPGLTALQAFRSTEETKIHFGNPSDDWPLRTLLSFASHAKRSDRKAIGLLLSTDSHKIKNNDVDDKGTNVHAHHLRSTIQHKIVLLIILSSVPTRFKFGRFDFKQVVKSSPAIIPVPLISND